MTGSSIQPGTWPLDVLPDAVRKELLEGAPALALEPGQVLYRTGDSATSFFVVTEGELELLVKARTRDHADARTVPSGCVIGIEALLAERDHLEEARARGRAVVLEIGRGRFERARRDPTARAQLATAKEVALRRRAECVLETSTLGQGLSPALFNLLISSCEWGTRKRGEVLFAPGDRSDAALLLAEGVVRLVRPAGSAEEKTVAYLQAGDVVGADEVVSGSSRTLKAVADTPVEFFRIAADALRQVARQAPEAVSMSSRAAAERQDTIRAAVEKSGSMAELFTQTYRLQVAGAMLVIDPELCVRCGICAWSCSQTHGASRLVRRGDKMLLPTAGASSSPRPLLLPNSCQHCTNPACMQDCPTAAIAKSSEGEVYIRSELCTGCGSCARDCPWDNIVLAPRPQHPLYDTVAVKCDLCIGYGISACVHNCPVGAIFRITPADDVAFVRLLAPSLGGRAGRTESRRRPGLAPLLIAWLVPLLLVALPALFFAASAAGARTVGTGVAAAATMLGLSAYGLRKRGIRLAMWLWKGLAGRAGGGAGLEGTVDLRLWLPVHVVLGLALLAWIVAHAGLTAGGSVTSALQASTAVAVLSGLWGMLRYRTVPSRLTRLEEKARLPEDYTRDIAQAQEALDRMLDRMGDAPREIVARARSRGGAAGRRRPQEESEHLWNVLSVEERRVAGAAGHRAIEELANVRSLSAALRLTRSLRAWLPVHVGSMAMALLLLVLHVVQVLVR